MGLILVAAFVLLALGAARHPTFKAYSFTLWVFACVAGAMTWPQMFGIWFGFDLKFSIVPLIQIIMFGMGTTLSVADFARVLVMPWPVIVGVCLHYMVMPVVAWTLTKIFGFEPEIAVGVVLVGSTPGGVASNVINYLAKCNVPLSVTMTAISTMISPLMTPLMVGLLAGKHIEVGFVKMMVDIFNIIVVPILAGLIANRILYATEKVFRQANVLLAISFLGLALALGAIVSPPAWLGAFRGGLALGFAMVGLVVLAKLVIEIWAGGPRNWMDRVLPLVSMAAICGIIAIVTARASGDLKRVGITLLIASTMHNLLGYLFGYWLARAARLNITDARTVAVEVGMQNAGMASALAMTTLASSKAAIAAAIFGPWQNVSGSVLASWWRKRPPGDLLETKLPASEPQTVEASAKPD